MLNPIFPWPNFPCAEQRESMNEEPRTGKAGAWAVALAITAGLACVVCAAFASWGGLSIYIDPTQLMGTLAPLLLTAVFIERAVEVVVSPWRDAESDARRAALGHAKGAIAPDPVALHAAQKALTEYRVRTQQYAFAAAVLLGGAASSVGVRALWPFLNNPKLGGVSAAQTIAFHLVDITLSAVMLAGGAAGIHSVVSAFTNFFDAAGNKARKSAAS